MWSDTFMPSTTALVFSQACSNTSTYEANQDLHIHGYLHVCVLHQVVLKVRTRLQGDVLAHVHLAPLCPPVPPSPFIHNRVNEICHHLALRLLWVRSFLCQVKIIERFLGCIWPLGSWGGPGWLICFYCRFSRGNVLNGGEDREEVTRAFRLVVRRQECCHHLLRILLLPTQIHIEKYLVCFGKFCPLAVSVMENFLKQFNKILSHAKCFLSVIELILQFCIWSRAKLCLWCRAEGFITETQLFPSKSDVFPSLWMSISCQCQQFCLEPLFTEGTFIAKHINNGVFFNLDVQ